MVKTPYWEDVQEGMAIPDLRKNASTQQLVKYAGASLDWYQIHYDLEFARGNKLDGLIIHGALKNAWLGQVVTDWMGMEGVLRKLSVQYRGMDVPNDALVCKGVVKKKYEQGGHHLVDLEIWLENGKGEKTTPGEATVSLPLRMAR